MKVFVYCSVLFLLTNCSTTKTDNRIKKKIHTIELQLSRAGAGYSYLSNEKPLPNVSDEIYKFNLDKTGNLKSVFGYGAYNSRDLNIKILSPKHNETILSQKHLNWINKLASGIKNKQHPKFRGNADDSWFIKLKIDQETFIYDMGIASSENGREYKDIVTEIVKRSKFKVEDWNWYSGRITNLHLRNAF